MERRLVVIGSGKVARTLALAARGTGFEPVQVYARNRAEGRAAADACGVAYTAEPASLAQADLYLIAVSDRAIGEVAQALSFPAGAVVAHTAGGIALDVLPRRIAHRAVIYPLQTFSPGREPDLLHTPFFIEGATPHALETARTFATGLSRQVMELDSGRRALLHLAGVFANNFVNYLYTAAETVASQAGMPFEVLKPILLETALKATEAASARPLQTGPAVRGDRITQRIHRQLLHDNPALRTIYEQLSDQIWETSKKT